MSNMSPSPCTLPGFCLPREWACRPTSWTKWETTFHQDIPMASTNERTNERYEFHVPKKIEWNRTKTEICAGIQLDMLSPFLAGSAGSAPPENERVLDWITASQGIASFYKKQTYGNAAVHVPIMSVWHKWHKDFSEKIPSHMSKPPEIERYYTQSFHSCHVTIMPLSIWFYSVHLASCNSTISFVSRTSPESLWFAWKASSATSSVPFLSNTRQSQSLKSNCSNRIWKLRSAPRN